MEKPVNIPDYMKWLNVTHNCDVDCLSEIYYDAVSSKIKYDFETSKIWEDLTSKLLEYDQKYLLDSQYKLLLTVEPPKLLIKPYKSFILKTYRKNILNNDYYPDNPKTGWCLPDNWYNIINDMVRTCFVVKYLDGVEFFIERIKELSEDLGKECKVDLEAKEEGYYAAHVYVIDVFEIPKPNWDTIKIQVSIELQITTQLQENIRSLLHKYYERRRELLKKENIKWQWDYLSDEFSTNYLGHILHYIEGMIMEIREKQMREKM